MLSAQPRFRYEKSTHVLEPRNPTPSRAAQLLHPERKINGSAAAPLDAYLCDRRCRLLPLPLAFTVSGTSPLCLPPGLPYAQPYAMAGADCSHLATPSPPSPL